jgi:hypothetical protein
MNRVVVVSNKWWECDPIVFALLNSNVIPPNFPWPDSLESPRKRPDQNHLPPENPSPVPRAIFRFKNITVELWCISDLLEHLPDKGAFQSSSEQKAKVLPKIFRFGPTPSLVIALGTAGLPNDASSENGNVVLGTNIFMHDPHPGGSNLDSKWSAGPFDEIINSPLSPSTFSAMTQLDWGSVSNRFLPVPINQAASNRSLANYDNVDLVTVNVTNYAEYAVTDPEIVRLFAHSFPAGAASSLETTHGLIRVQSEAPFLFVSGITDRLGHFDQEVTPRSHPQNTAPAHNAGVALAWLLPQIDAVL